MKLNTCYYKFGSLLLCALLLGLSLEGGQGMQSLCLWIIVVFYLAEFIAESKTSPTDDTKTLKAIEAMKALKSDTKTVKAIEALKALKSDSKHPKQVKGDGDTKNNSDNAGDITQSAAKDPVDIEFSKWDKELPNLPDLPVTTPGTEIEEGLDKSKDKGLGNNTTQTNKGSSVKKGSAEGIIEKIKGLKVKEGNQTNKIQKALCVSVVEIDFFLVCVLT